ncbi:MAG: hypothetical protein GYA46_01160 [candidate division Zixibacteria bacterium]|nr:hypothetical protein [candidate division Zixibacteria bacterium]
MVSTIGGVSMIVGIVLSLRAMWLGTVKEPLSRSGEPMIGVPFWKMKSYLSPKAFRTYVTGTALMVLGSLLVVVRYWLL